MSDAHWSHNVVCILRFGEGLLALQQIVPRVAVLAEGLRAGEGGPTAAQAGSSLFWGTSVDFSSWTEPPALLTLHPVLCSLHCLRGSLATRLPQVKLSFPVLWLFPIIKFPMLSQKGA